MQVKIAMLISITLSGFVRRTQKSHELKAAIKSTGATLSRKGRSRNWVLTGDHQQVAQIMHLISQAGEESWLWVSKKLFEYRPKLSRNELRNLVKQDPTMTVSQLTALTDCTLMDARTVLDEIEWE